MCSLAFILQDRAAKRADQSASSHPPDTMLNPLKLDEPTANEEWFIRVASAVRPEVLPLVHGEISGPFKTLEIKRFIDEGFLDGLAELRPATKEGDSSSAALWKEIGQIGSLRDLVIAVEDEEEEEEDEGVDATGAPLSLPEGIPPELASILSSAESARLAQIPLSPAVSGKAASSTAAADDEGKPGETIGADRRKKQRKKPITAVFVSGLPVTSLTEEKFIDHMKRGGVIRIHPDTLRPHVKLYQNRETGEYTGDALCVYAKAASVSLAVKYLDGSSFEGQPIKVEKAQFEAREKKPEAGLPDTEQQEQLRKKRRLAARIEEQRHLGWAEGAPTFARTAKSSKVLILRPCWTAEQAERYKKSSVFWGFLKAIIESQLKRMKAPARRVLPIARHPLGVVCLKFRSTEEADNFLQLCLSAEIELSPLRLLPGFEDKPSDLAFYDGKVDFAAQALEETGDTFQSDTGLDAIDRLWLQAAGIPPGELDTAIPAPIRVREKPIPAAPPPVTVVGTVSPSADIPVAAADSVVSEAGAPPGEAEREEAFGDWLEEQSSDEEFTIQTAPSKNETGNEEDVEDNKP